MATITNRIEQKRGCGFRKPGGTYLVSNGISAACGKLPLALEVCPCCGQGIKPARGWTWVDADKLLSQEACTAPARQCAGCPLADGRSIGNAGLLWIGEKFYGTPDEWIKESINQGISRRISQIPRDFQLGKTWVLTAHRKAVSETCPECLGGNKTHAFTCERCDGTRQIHKPGIFHAFLPTAIEYVVKGTETQDELEKLEKRGLTLVKIEYKGEQPPLIQPDTDDAE